MTEKPTVHQALAAVMGDVQAVRKGDRNADQGYSFRGIDAVVNAVGPALRTHGVIVAPVNVEAHYRDVTTSRGKPSRECTVLATYRIYGPAGDYIEAMAPGESMDFGDKGAPKAMSVAMRILLLQALCIPTDEPDPDAQSYERATQETPEQSAQRQAAKEAYDRSVAQVRKLGTDLGWEGKALIKDYADRHEGADINTATSAELDEYAVELAQLLDQQAQPAGEVLA